MSRNSFRPQVEQIDSSLVSSLNDLMNDMMHIGTMQVAPGSTHLGHQNINQYMTTDMKEKFKRNKRGLQHRLKKRTGKKSYNLKSSYNTDNKITSKFLTKIVPMSVRIKAVEKARVEADPTQQTFGNTEQGPIMTLTPIEDLIRADPSLTVVGKLVRPKKKKKHYMMSKPWVNTALRTIPDGAEDESKRPMRRRLQLEHVFGYRAQDVRNNLFYAKGGTVTYIAAALGVCINPDVSREQRYMPHHNDDILSIALYDMPKKNTSIVATGEIGTAPRIMIWFADSMKTITTLRATHQRGVCQLAFSPDGATLASVGLDNFNCLSLHNWRSGDLLVKIKTGGDKVFGLIFRPSLTNPEDDTQLITCGHKHMTFWKRPDRSHIESRSARFGRELAGDVSVYDVCFDRAGRTIAATNLGHLLIFNTGKSCLPLRTIPQGEGSIANGHEGTINSVQTVPGGAIVVSGGSDGLIRLWSCPENIQGNVQLIKTLDAHMHHTRVENIQSLCLNMDGSRCLVGTRGGDITEIEMNTNTLLHDRPLVTGHCFGELWGLACHPILNAVFATSGDDKTIRMWHIGGKECTAMTAMKALPDMSRALVFEPTQGEWIVAGIGGRVAGRNVGKFGKHAGKLMTLNTKTLEVYAEMKIAKEQISDLTFSSDGRILMCASNDQFIYILSVNGPTNIEKKYKCGGHSSFVTDISISENDQYLMSNDGAGEILFWNIETGEREPDAEVVQSCIWSPNTCPMSWESVGIWPNSGDLTDINAMESSSELNMIVTADDFGRVNTFNSPATSFSAPHMTHVGHSSHVTNVCFNCDQTRVISVGGNDRCAFVWRVVEIKKGSKNKMASVPKKKKPVVSVGDTHLDEEGLVPERSLREMKEKEKPRGPPPAVLTEDGSVLDSNLTVVGRYVKPKKHKKHYMQTKTWVSVAKRSCPLDAVDEGRKPIDRCLNLEHVHGFSAQTSRNNVLYTKSGTIVYIAAALGVCIDPTKSDQQRYMSEHTDDLLSIALWDHPKRNGSIIATGEIGKTPKIIIWMSDTMRTLNILKGTHTRGVVQLAFSPDGATLASIGLDNQNSLALHDWKKNTLLTKMRTGGDKVFGLIFSTNETLVSCGHRNMSFWKRPNAKTLEVSAARFGRELAGEISIIDVCFDKFGRTIVATNLGHIGVFLMASSGTNMLALGKGSVANAHEKALNCVEIMQNEECFVSAGSMGVIKLWKCPKDCTKTIQVLQTFDAHEGMSAIPAVQSLSISYNSDTLLVGTRGGDIIELNIKDGGLVRETPLVTGHHYGELWGLATHPRNNAIFATSGDDKTVRMWHIGSKECIAQTTVPDMARSLCFDPDGEFIVAGLGGRLGLRKIGTFGEHAGSIVSMDARNLQILGILKVAKEQIGDMAFSVNGKTLAVASNDNFIYLVDVSGPTEMRVRHKCSGHSSFVTDISLSECSLWMMSNDGAGEILYWNALTGKREGDIDIFQKVVFAQNTCPLSWETIGCWPSRGDLTDINSSETSPQCGLAVTADDFGKIKLFNTPCISWDAPYYEHRGHSSHITNCMWNCDSSRVISVGGNDRCCMVWRVVEIE